MSANNGRPICHLCGHGIDVLSHATRMRPSLLRGPRLVHAHCDDDEDKAIANRPPEWPPYKERD